MVSSFFFFCNHREESWQGPQQTILFIPLCRAASTALFISGDFVLVPSLALGYPLWLGTFMDKSFLIISHRWFPPSFLARSPVALFCLPSPLDCTSSVLFTLVQVSPSIFFVQTSPSHDFCCPSPDFHVVAPLAV